MLRAIFASIAASLRSAFKGLARLGQTAWDYTWQATCYAADRVIDTGDALLRAPKGILGRLAGGGTPPLPQPECDASSKGERKARAEALVSGARDSQREAASVAWKVARARVAGEGIRSERVEQLMSRVSPEVRAWLDCLDAQELERVAGAGISRVAGHVSGRRPIHGVRGVGEWKAARTDRRVPTDDEFNAAFGMVPTLA